jgi:hypothetical protein
MIILISRLDVKCYKLDEILMIIYMYSRRDSHKICVGLVAFSRAADLTNCASYDTLAKLTRPGGVYKVLNTRPRGIYKHLEDLDRRGLEGYSQLLFLIDSQLIHTY